jgi:hypothetical protein
VKPSWACAAPVAAALLVLSGCAGTQPAQTASPQADPPSTASSPPATQPATQTLAAVVADASWEHVHNLALRGDELLVGTHEGLWTQLPGQSATRISDDPFDVMGLAVTSDGTLYASGHPQPGQDGPADLGLERSANGGRSWQPVSLVGEVDFHRVRTSEETVLGISAHDGRLLRSADAGESWADLGTPPLFDLAVDPTNADLIVATTPDGPVRSSDAGRTFDPIPGAPLLALLAWDGDTLYAIGADSSVQTSTDGGTTWTQIGQLQGNPKALAAQDQTLVALAGDTVWHSADGGRTFLPRITGLPDH